MIFDCHTHLIEKEHLTGNFLSDALRVGGQDYNMTSTYSQHSEAMKDCSGAIVLAVDAPYIGFNVPNEYVAEYVAKDPTRMFGFASVDPNRIGAENILENAVRELGLVGLKLAPIYQNFHPQANIAYPVYAKAQELKLPVMWHQGTSYPSQGPLDISRPVFLDPVARSFPDLKMIIAHLGHPWMGEAISVVRKHPNLFADISALGKRPWQMYNAMIEAIEYGIEDKLLFGTDYPNFTVEQTVDALTGLNRLVEGTNLPRIPDRVIDKILNKNAPEVLGLV
ncbi:amidohydrolase family protein [Cohnella silvisoli]|uniref:Amidohydrolase family protein n=1 Tax=Cohnella silvisoli TaxID=2873699 RepID=A0ABV1L3N6_9BACL|nr:amidohydrolase family protein [Cohnella silvisoli]MCD9026241.1 amidohydrolase family protein [Cohnella silvisoli]